MSSDPYLHPATASDPPLRQSRHAGLGPLGIGMLVVGGGILLLFLISPFMRSARPAAYRMQCSNNLKQIGLALHNYRSVYGAFPPVYTVDADGSPLHSWRTLILPYCEQQQLYDQLDLTIPWDAPANAEVFQRNWVPAYACPLLSGETNQTCYLAIVGPETCLREISQTTEEPDGDIKRLMIVEVPEAKAVPWMQPVDVSLEGLVETLKSSQGFHAGGSHGLFSDGSVRFLSTELRPGELDDGLLAAGVESADR